MKAIGYRTPDTESKRTLLADIEIPRPQPTGQDLLVEIRAVSVNPVDYKVRKRAGADGEDYKILGWDASGVVVETGSGVTMFEPGDEVFYAGSIARPGTNAEFHLVDERIVGHKPASLDWGQAAALPLTSLTAWEALFDRLEVRRPVTGGTNTILIVGGAGGVGSVAIQLVRQLTDLTIIATASRPETVDWVKSLGAHHVIDHGRPLAEEVARLGIGAPEFVFSTTQTDQHFRDIAELIAPQGRFVLIDDPVAFDPMVFKMKAVSIHYELMFTRSLFATADMAEQHRILDEVSKLVDAGKLSTTLTRRMTPISAATLNEAHDLLESGAMRGKLVVEGF